MLMRRVHISSTRTEHFSSIRFVAGRRKAGMSYEWCQLSLSGTTSNLFGCQSHGQLLC